jgi:hypothetical protein
MADFEPIEADAPRQFARMNYASAAEQAQPGNHSHDGAAPLRE